MTLARKTALIGKAVPLLGLAALATLGLAAALPSTPEPSSLAVFALAGVGLLGLTLRARKCRSQAV